LRDLSILLRELRLNVMDSTERRQVSPSMEPVVPDSKGTAFDNMIIWPRDLECRETY
jgi:hypothetical protein